MDEQQQKVRLIMIAVSGVLLLGGVGGWLMFANNKPEQVEETATTQTATPAPAVTPASDPAAPAASPVAPSTPAAAPAAPATPVATTPAAQDASSTPIPEKPPATAANQLLAANTPSAVPPVGDSNPAPAAAAPISRTLFPATKRDEASAEARQVAGRKDPMQPTAEHATFPQWSKGGVGGADEEGDKPEVVKVPPPPPEIPSTKNEKLAPPPPPPSDSAVGTNIPGVVDPGQLPMPPEKPSVAQFLKLTAIVGNKAILSVPANVRSMTKWPAIISLGPGEKIEDTNNAALSVVSVDPDSVTIDEDGERSVKTLPTIR